MLCRRIGFTRPPRERDFGLDSATIVARQDYKLCVCTLALVGATSVACAPKTTSKSDAAFTAADAPLESAAPVPIVVVAAGDIGDADPAMGKQAQTADLVSTLIRDRNVRAVLALGDLAYWFGSHEDYRTTYHPYWGRPDIGALIRPVPGNHEYRGDPEATAYFDYFNGVGRPSGTAGDRSRGYYSYDIGAWHFVALNTAENPGCVFMPCDQGSPQLEWLRGDLAANTKACTLAYWHHPRFNQALAYGDHPAVAPLWDALHDAHADVVLNGHVHNYQQFSPADKAGARDPKAGIRSFIVGTGGMAALYPDFTDLHADILEFKDAAHFGVLELVLNSASYSWRFVTTAEEVLASGTDFCR
jgi:hypothetical protein